MTTTSSDFKEIKAQWHEKHETQKQAWLTHINELERALTRRNERIEALERALPVNSFDDVMRELVSELATHLDIYYDLTKPHETIREAIEVLYNLNDDPGSISDGHHTFSELYEYRTYLHAIAVRHWMERGIHVIKSHCHADGEECFGGGYFIVQTQLRVGQVSNHYENKYWDLFPCEEVEKASLWDGHDTQDALTRLRYYAATAPTPKREDTLDERLSRLGSDMFNLRLEWVKQPASTKRDMILKRVGEVYKMLELLDGDLYLLKTKPELFDRKDSDHD